MNHTEEDYIVEKLAGRLLLVALIDGKRPLDKNVTVWKRTVFVAMPIDYTDAGYQGRIEDELRLRGSSFTIRNEQFEIREETYQEWRERKLKEQS